MDIIARKREKQLLESVLWSKSSELVTVYGRRRIGKTYLVRNFFESCNVIYEELLKKSDSLHFRLKKQKNIFF